MITSKKGGADLITDKGRVESGERRSARKGGIRCIPDI